MSNVKTIKEILNSKENLEQSLNQANEALERLQSEKLSNLITLWHNTNYRLDFRADYSLIEGLLKAQIQLYKAELEKINKKLDAIAAIMSADL